MQPPSPSDPNLAGARPSGRATGARRRPRGRVSGHFANLLLMIVFGPSTLLLWAMIYLVLNQCHWMQAQVTAKQAQLTAFNKQYEVGQRRLASLQSNKGNEEILIENGYIPPGDRILLFPATPEEQRKAATSPNDLSPHEPVLGAAPPSATASSVWRSAGDVLHNWWVAARVAAGDKSVAKSPGAKAAGAGASPALSGDATSGVATAAPLANDAPETTATDANAAPTSATTPSVTPSSASPEANSSSEDVSPDTISTPSPTRRHGKRHHTLSVESDADARP